MKANTQVFLNELPEEIKPMMDQAVEDFENNWPDACVANDWPVEEHDNFLEVFLIGAFTALIQAIGPKGKDDESI